MAMDNLNRVRGISELRTVKDMEKGGVKKQGKSGDVLYGRPPKLFEINF